MGASIGRFRGACAVGLAAVLVLGTGWWVSARAAGPLPPLTGPPLNVPTRLRLIVGTTPPVVLAVDAGTTATVPGVVPGPYTQLGQPRVGQVFAADGGAYMTVVHGNASSGYLIRGDGTAQPAAGGRDAIPARNGAAVWLLTRSDGRCTLRLVPSTGSPVPAPCGQLLVDSPAGLVIQGSTYWMLVNPSTGRLLKRIRVRVSGAAWPISGSFVLENTSPDLYAPGKLRLIDVNTGASRRLRWPSILPSVQRIAVQPNGPLVAVGFVSVAYPGPQQANDVWLLNTTTGAFTHLPGFPAQESIKFSGMAWTTDGRLVVVDETNTTPAVRAVLGIWTPGQTTLPLRSVPPLANTGGYYSFVPVAG
jgi:hypothetical protein